MVLYNDWNDWHYEYTCIYLPDVLPRPLQNHFLVLLHMTTADGSCIPQYL